MVVPAALAFEMVSAPVAPLTLITPPLPGQLCHDGAPAVETKHKPAPPAATDVIGLVPLPSSTPFAVRLAAPVPPCATLNAVVRPDSDVMSLLAPDAAAPRLVRAAGAVIAPVPP